ncbi:hypothetical protein [Roseomonas rosulenta]|uniref:hypothetical protein n=1 Tax=Roseomonas rosulenta TaxID=2748667 RepID=UPI0018DFD6EC|nr:hypothetical protein [Roseomonas rosulenta]
MLEEEVEIPDWPAPTRVYESPHLGLVQCYDYAEIMRRGTGADASANQPSRPPTKLEKREAALRDVLLAAGVLEEDWQRLGALGISRKALWRELRDSAPELFADLTEDGFRVHFLRRQKLVRIDRRARR